MKIKLHQYDMFKKDVLVSNCTHYCSFGIFAVTFCFVFACLFVVVVVVVVVVFGGAVGVFVFVDLFCLICSCGIRYRLPPPSVIDSLSPTAAYRHVLSSSFSFSIGSRACWVSINSV